MSALTAKHLSKVSCLRLHSDPPHPDESISSAIDRAASLWGLRRREVLLYLGHRHTCYDFDALIPASMLASMSNAFGVELQSLSSIAVPKCRRNVLAHPKYRTAYCPLCFEEDWRSGITPYFRLDWGRLFASHCRVHETPLFEWQDLSSGGQRRLPHACYLPFSEAAYLWFDGEAKLPSWMDANLRAACYWQSSLATDPGTYELWKALIKVEELWWNEGLGDPLREVTDAVRQREKMLLKLASLFLSEPRNFPLCLVEMLSTPRYQYHVFGYDRRRNRRMSKNPNGVLVRNQLPAIQARRAVFILVAHTLGQLDIDLQFETGARIPSGRSAEWISHVLKYQDYPRHAKTVLRAAIT